MVIRRGLGYMLRFESVQAVAVAAASTVRVESELERRAMWGGAQT